MEREADGKRVVRADLRDRVQRLQSLCSRDTPPAFYESLDDVRRIALDYHFDAVATLADSYARMPAVARGRKSAALLLDRLEDAIACDGRVPASGEAIAASLTVRFQGT